MFRGRSPYPLSVAAILVLLLGLLMTIVLVTGARRLEQEAEALDFQQRAKYQIKLVRQGMEDAVISLDLVNQLFATVDSVTREQFRIFTEPLLQRYPYILAFNFHRVIPEAGRGAYEATMRRTYPRFTMTEMQRGRIVPADSRERHIVVDYLEPMAGNEAAFGLDVAPNRYVIDAIGQATDSGLAMSTGLLHLAQDAGVRSGFVVVKPVYRKGMPLGNVEARRAALIGDTAAVFIGADLVRKILSGDRTHAATGISISVYAGESNAAENLVYRSQANAESGAVDWLPDWARNGTRLVVADSFSIAGMPWQIIIFKNTAPISSANSGSSLLLVAGLLFSLLACAYVQTLSVRASRIQRQVDERTAEARHANQLLMEDIAVRERTEQALQLRQRAIEASANAIIITSAEPPLYPIEYVNPAFERMTGYKAGEVIGQGMKLLVRDDRDQPAVAEFKAATEEQREGHAVMRSYRKDGTLFWNDLYIAPVKDGAGKVTHFVAAQYDITATRQYQDELEFRSSYDTLTGLANRNLLRDRLGQAIAYAARYHHPVWAVFIDLDRFKFVNDTLGHDAGDLLLKTMAERLQAAVRTIDTVARLGSDEFMLLLPERIEEKLSTGSIRRIMEAVAQPLTIEGHEFFLTCSAGIAVYPTDGEDPDTLIQRADIAMYRAKEMGRGNFQFYAPSMNEGALERLRIEGDLRTALERSEFILHYQPQVNMSSGRIVGMEALIRWQHPELGLISPARFIALAEETGLIVPIGAWVLRTACAQTRAWQRAGYGDLRIAVNLSARQFAQQDLVNSIATALYATGLDPSCLEIELTESLIMTDVEHAIGTLRDLKALGVKLSIDDFGTGYSSLSYLKRFPIDVLKIDQSFVRDITLDADDAAIVASIISLAQGLRLQVIAEGVETEEQLAYLWHHGCDEMQGYHFSPPVPAAQFEVMLRDGKKLPPQLEREWTEQDLRRLANRKPN